MLDVRNLLKIMPWNVTGVRDESTRFFAHIVYLRLD